MSDWTLRQLDTIEDGFDGSKIEIFFAMHHSIDRPFDALVIRTTSYDAHVASEVWIGADAVHAVASTLEANRPGQLQLFDQDAM